MKIAARKDSPDKGFPHEAPNFWRLYPTFAQMTPIQLAYACAAVRRT